MRAYELSLFRAYWAVLRAGVLAAQSKASVPGKDGRVYFKYDLGFCHYWSEGVDVLLFLVKEEDSWVAYLADLADGEVRRALDVGSFRRTPQWFAEESPFFSKRRHATQQSLAGAIDALFKTGPPKSVANFVATRFSLPQKVRDYVARKEKWANTIEEKSIKRGYHPSNYRLCFKEKMQADFARQCGHNKVEKYIKKQAECDDLDTYHWMVILSLQVLAGKKPVKLGPKGQEASPDLALYFLRKAREYEISRGFKSTIGVHHMSAIDARHYGIYGKDLASLREHYAKKEALKKQQNA